VGSRTVYFRMRCFHLSQRSREDEAATIKGCHTRDVGYLDDEAFSISPTASPKIISGGVNIYPQETRTC